MGRLAKLAGIFAAGLALGAGEAGAEAEAPVVVELFTSQGCASCPPADKYLGELAKRDDVIALSLHVDYWDYLGWTDKFGSAAHTSRQRDYAAAMRERMIYTPQMMVQGREHVVGSRTGEVDQAIARQAGDVAATVSLSLDGAQVVAEITPLDPGAKARGHVLMAWYARAETVAIKGGENRGRKIEYHNIVKGWSDLGTWSGDRVRLTAPKPMDADGLAILVQEGDGGPIIAAGKLALK